MPDPRTERGNDPPGSGGAVGEDALAVPCRAVGRPIFGGGRRPLRRVTAVPSRGFVTAPQRQLA